MPNTQMFLLPRSLLALAVTARNPTIYTFASDTHAEGYAGEYSTYHTGCSAPENDFDLGYRTLDVDAVVGGQLDVALGRRTVGLGARYTHGFLNVSRYDTLRNRALSLYGSVELSRRR